MSSTTVDLSRPSWWAKWYARQGYNPLPSMAEKKRPAMSCYKKERDNGISDKQLESWWAPNIQVCTGVRWNLIVLDIDGSDGWDQWQHWCRRWGCPETWEVQSGSGNRHYWFTVPSGVTSLPTTLLWQGQGHKQLIELIGDRGLIVAPPSSYGTRSYQFVHAQTIHEPATLPFWVYRLAVPVCRCRRSVATPLGPLPRSRNGHRQDRATVLTNLSPDQKLAIIGQWGLRIVDDRPDPDGWIVCRAYDRPDNNPSATFNLVTGYYYDFATRERLSMCDLGVALGASLHWQDTLSYLGELTHA